MQTNSLLWRLTKTDIEAAIAMLGLATERYPGGSDPWRTPDAWVRSRSVDGFQIHGATFEAAVAKLEDISPKPRAGDRRH